MVLVRKWQFFPTYFFNAILARKIFFTIFYNVKPTFQAIKTRSLKNRKIIIFSKGLTHGFGPKKAIFLKIFFWAIQARKMSFRIFQNEETSFQAIKTRSLKRRKIDIFSKGLTHGFWSKNSHLFKIFFRQYRQGKCLLRYSGTKKHLSRLEKQKSSKSRKINVFPNSIIHGFGPKMASFPNFFFSQYRPGKCLLLDFTPKKRLSML